jgi:hypothetical protein
MTPYRPSFIGPKRLSSWIFRRQDIKLWRTEILHSWRLRGLSNCKAGSVIPSAQKRQQTPQSSLRRCCWLGGFSGVRVAVGRLGCGASARVASIDRASNFRRSRQSCGTLDFGRRRIRKGAGTRGRQRTADYPDWEAWAWLGLVAASRYLEGSDTSGIAAQMAPFPLQGSPESCDIMNITQD